MDIRDEKFENPEVETLVYEKMGEVLVRCCDPDIKEYKVERGVVIIAANSFIDCDNLETVFIPYCVQFIGEHAFRNCRKLKRVIIEWRYMGLDAIYQGAFSGCTNLQWIELPKSLTTIDSYAFANCVKLRNLTLPASLKEVGINPFLGCNINIKSRAKDFKVYRNLLIKQSFQTVIASLKDSAIVIIPDDVQYIGRSAFENRKSLEMVILPLMTRKIEERAFYYCSNLRNVYSQGDIYAIDKDAFRHSGLRTFICNFEITAISCGAFGDCEHLRKFTCSKDCHIERGAFKGSENVRFVRMLMLSQIKN